jgi:lipoprotein-releasing system permease protein
MRLVLFLSLRQLWEKKLLNFIAIAGVALGVSALITMNAIMQGFQMKFKGEILKISPHVTVYSKELRDHGRMLAKWSGARDGEAPVLAAVARDQPSERQGRIKRPHEVVRVLESMPGVDAACRGIEGQAIVSFGAKTSGVDLRGIDPDDQNRCTPLSGYLPEGGWRTFAGDRDSIIIGSGVAETLGAKVGDRVGLVSPGGRRIAVTLAGVFDIGIPAVDRSRVYVHLPKAQTVLSRGNDVGRIEVRLAQPFESESFARRAERITGYDAEGWQEANANFLSLFDLQNMIVTLQIGLILTVGGFGILAIQIMLVLQKTRDISILRSVGLRRADILGVVLVQGLLVAALGGLLGDILGWRLVTFLGGLKVQSEGLIKSSTFVVYEDPWFYVYGVAFAVAVGLVASLLPALRASRVEPVSVLRGQIG